MVVMTIVLFVISSLYVLHHMSNFIIEELERSVDISAYFVDSATEEEIFQVQEEISQLAEVRNVEYISKENAFERFVERHQQERAFLEPLESIGQNPFRASLNIQAQDTSDFADIAEFLSTGTFGSLIENVDFYNRAAIIDQISIVTGAIRAAALAIIIFLSSIAVLVAFNTIRLTIYNSRKEIEIMRLVGASSAFIRGPFFVQGIIVGVAASMLTLILLLLASLIIGGRVEHFTGFPLSSFVLSHFFIILLLQLAVGIVLGTISSAIAIRRYLRV